MSSYKSRKSIKGDDNEQNEIASHNRISFSDSGSLKLLTIYLCAVATAAVVFVGIVHLVLLETLVVSSVVGIVVLAWIIALSFTIRHVSTTRTSVAVDETERSQAQIKADILHATENYILWRDPDGSYQFRGSTMITENRQFLPQAIAAPDATELILTCFDGGMSGRSIEKWLKDKGDKKITYHQIAKTLNLYRPEWNKKTVEAGQPEDEYPV